MSSLCYALKTIFLTWVKNEVYDVLQLNVHMTLSGGQELSFFSENFADF